MPLLFFDLKSGDVVLDREGQDFADQAAAIRAAMEAAIDVARDDFPAGLSDQVTVQLRSANGRIVATVSVSLQVSQTS